MEIGFHWGEWGVWLGRWIHLIAGISWIGSSFYFMWLDAHLKAADSSTSESDPLLEGNLWMVHSGGFYRVERRKLNPGKLPDPLHWFKYEALLSWVSGVFLLSLVYYLNPFAFLIDPAVMAISPGLALAGILSIFSFSWLSYDFLWKKWGRSHSVAATGISILLATLAAFGFCHFLSGRAAFIHTGALLGTWMVANVWFRIIPAQQEMVDATEKGRKANYELSQIAKQRSTHNSYMTFPVLLMMLSNHYPMAYGSRQNGWILISLMVFGVSIRHLMLVRHGRSAAKETGAKKSAGKWAVLTTAFSVIALLFLSSDPVRELKLVKAVPSQIGQENFGAGVEGAGIAGAESSGEKVSFDQVRAVISQRCEKCHSATPQDPTFGPSPGGVRFETPQQIQALAARIKVRAVDTKTMPLANRTGISDEERRILGRWVDQGAPIDDSLQGAAGGAGGGSAQRSTEGPVEESRSAEGKRG